MHRNAQWAKWPQNHNCRQGVRPAQSAGRKKHHEKITHAPHRRWPFRWVSPKARPLHDLGIFDEDSAATCAYPMCEGMVAVDRPRATHPAQPSRHVTVFGDCPAKGKRAAVHHSGYTRNPLSAVILTAGRFTLTCNRPEGRLRRVCAGVVVVRIPPASLPCVCRARSTARRRAWKRPSGPAPPPSTPGWRLPEVLDRRGSGISSEPPPLVALSPYRDSRPTQRCVAYGQPLTAGPHHKRIRCRRRENPWGPTHGDCDCPRVERRGRVGRARLARDSRRLLRPLLRHPDNRLPHTVARTADRPHMGSPRLRTGRLRLPRGEHRSSACLTPTPDINDVARSNPGRARSEPARHQQGQQRTGDRRRRPAQP